MTAANQLDRLTLLQSVIHDPGNYRDWEIKDLIDRRYELAKAKTELNAQVNAVKEQVDLIEALLWEYHEQNPEVAQIEGAQAKIRWSTENQYSTEAGTKEEVRDWLYKNGHEYLMTWHLNRASTEEFMQLHGELPPNVTVFEKRKTSCTKL